MLTVRDLRRPALSAGASLLCLTLLGVLSCESATKPPPPPVYAIVALSGDGASGEVGGTVTPQPGVRVTADGGAAAGIVVAWSAEDGGSVASGNTVTDALGVASVEWTLGTRPGSNHLRATLAGGQSVRLTASAAAGPVATVVLRPDSLVLADVGDSAALAATAQDRYGNELPGLAAAWRSLDPAIATVSARGTVLGAGAGRARIVASSGSAADTAQVDVRRQVGSIAVSPRTAALGALGATVALAAVVRDRRGAEMPETTIQWSSSDTAVASVDAGGRVTARRNGTATVHAAAGVARDSASVTVRQVAASLRVDPATVLLPAGDSVHLTASVLDSLGSALPDVPVTWTSSAPALATIGAGGWVRGERPGALDVSATSGAFTAGARVTVVAGRPALVRVTPDTAKVYVGATVPLTATVADVRGNPLPAVGVRWTTSDRLTAIVDGGGGVMGVSVGRATISAEVGGVTGSAHVIVVAQPRAASVRISPRGSRLNYIGATARLSAQILDAAGVPLVGDTPTWTSSAACVGVTGGVVRWASACSPGTTVMISAWYGALRDTVLLVPRQVIRTITLQPGSLSLNVGSTGIVAATVSDSAGYLAPFDPGAACSTSGPVSCAIDPLVDPQAAATTLRVTLLGEADGAVMLTVGAATATLPVKVRLRAGARIAMRSVTLNYVGATAQLTGVVLDGFGNPIAGAVPSGWSSLDPAAATVSSNGVVTEVAPGSARIVAVYGPTADTVRVTTRQVARTVVLSPGAVSVQVGDSVWVSGAVVDSGGAPMPNSMMSATLSGTAFVLTLKITPSPATSGVWVRGVAPGTGTVTLFYDPGLRANANVTVVPRPSGSTTPVTAAGGGRGSPGP